MGDCVHVIVWTFVDMIMEGGEARLPGLALSVICSPSVRPEEEAAKVNVPALLV